VIAVTVSAIALSAQQPPSARAIAPVDLTGYWVSVVSEDWQWRMVTPRKGDYASIPLNAAGTKLADQWSPAEDGSCKAYGAPLSLRNPTRIHVTWENDQTLRIETDAGRQTRRLHFGGRIVPARRDLQGHSAAEWQMTRQAIASSGADGGVANPNRPAPTWASLKVVTTNMQAGWLRRNGVPFSDKAVLTEYFDTFSDGPDQWFTVTTIVEDPAYLTQPFIVSSNFRKEADASRWNPVPCRP
jgi:hypothetical protein